MGFGNVRGFRVVVLFIRGLMDVGFVFFWGLWGVEFVWLIFPWINWTVFALF